MSESLALKYRPRRWADLVGQWSVQKVLPAMVARDQVPTVLLFDGIRGSGKTTTARILAAALNCEGEDAPCLKCEPCRAVADGTSLAVLEIDAASNGLVDDIRSLRERLVYSVGGKKRVVVLDEAHSIKRDAFNALLKTLEEPPPDTVFILLTTEPTKIPETIVSRCVSFTSRRIPLKAMVERLFHIQEKEGFEAEPTLLLAVARRANGGLRDAIMVLDQMVRAGVTTEEEFDKLMGEEDFAPALFEKMADGDFVAALKLLQKQMMLTGDYSAITSAMVRTLRDVVVLHSGGELERASHGVKVRQDLAKKLPLDKAMAAVRILWDLKTKVSFSDDPRGMLELSFLMMRESLGGAQTEVPAKAVETSTKRLTLAEMSNY